MRERAFPSSTGAPRTRLALALGAVLGLLGCGPEFDPPSQIDTLRVLGVQKDKPYAQPGEAVELTLLYHDGLPVDPSEPQRAITVAWLSGCWNPPGDLFGACIQQFSQEAALTGSVTLQYGNRASITTKPAPIQPRPRPSPDYDLGYVFFAVCAGTLVPALDGGEGLPLRCQDDSGRDLDSKDFIIGYTAIYVFANGPEGTEYGNANPEVTGFQLGGRELADDVSCVGDACLADCDVAGACSERLPTISADDCAEAGAPCLPRCKDDGDPVECPGYAVRPFYDVTVPAEPDSVSNAIYGRSNGEQMWINYYATRGAVKSSVRLLNDATKKYNADFGTEFYAPSEPGPLQIWAVVHDNRGGVAWSGATLYIQ